MKERVDWELQRMEAQRKELEQKIDLWEQDNKDTILSIVEDVRYLQDTMPEEWDEDIWNYLKEVWSES